MSDTPRRRQPRRPATAQPPAAGATGAPNPGNGPGEPRPSASKRGASRTLSDGRVQVLVYLPPAMVKEIKHAAVEQETSASHMVEQAIAHWLARLGGLRNAPPERP